MHECGPNCGHGIGLPKDGWVEQTLHYEDDRLPVSAAATLPDGVFNPHLPAPGWDEEWRALLGECSPEAHIGKYCLFHSPRLVFLRGRVRIDPFLNATCGLVAADAVHISSHVFLNGGPASSVRMGEWSFIGSGSRIITSSEDFTGKHGPIGPAGNNKAHRRDVTFSPYSGVAIGCSVLPGVTLPEGCCIAAHSLVRSSEGLSPWAVFSCAPGEEPEYLYARDMDSVIRLSKDPDFNNTPVRP